MMAEVPSHGQNLPAPVSRFIGHEHELREIKQHVSDHRLVMLTGAGGTGKTRLALQVGAVNTQRRARKPASSAI